jgi:toxin ParE1/3/4
MRGISLTARAHRDIASIWRYVATDNRTAADRHARQLAAQFDFLADNPSAGRLRPELSPHLRSWPVGSYVVFYRVLPGEIVIVRVLHASRDIDRDTWK